MLSLMLNALALPLSAEALEIQVESFLTRGFGMSDYFLEAKDSGGNGVQSLLEFPLDAWYAGGRIRLEDDEGGWSAGISGAINVGDPSSLMTDRDWDLYPGVPPVLWSYSESNLDYFSLDLRLEGDALLYRRGNLDLLITGGYRYYLIDQRITDFTIWQYQESGGDYSLVSYSSDADAIDYSIHYQIISAGLELQADLSDRVLLSLSGAPAAGFFFDRDDHILRTKLSTGRGLGYGVNGALSLELLFPGSHYAAAGTPYLRLFGEYGYFFSAGVQTQEWYGSADAVAEGTKISGIVHDVTLSEQRLGLAFGLKFGAGQ